MLVLGPDMRAADSPPDPYAAIRQRFLQVIEGHSFEVSRLARQAAERPAEQGDALRAIGLIAHRAAGVAATLGYGALGEIAADLDQKITLGLRSHQLRLSDVDGTIVLFQAAMHDAQIKQPA